MVKIVKVFFQKIKILLSELRGYRIAEINTQTQEVVFHIRNKGVFLRCSLSEAIAINTIINDLTPWDACLLGGYFGRVLRTSVKKGIALKKAKSMSFLLKDNGSQYKIVFQNRDGKIGYIDRKQKREFLEHPVTIANAQHVISKFDPSQACYIGILAGISIEKSIQVDERTGQHTLDNIMNKRSTLRIIE